MTTSHRSRLSSFILDCRTDDLDAAARFWSEALGRKVSVPQQGGEKYRTLAVKAAEPLLEVQQVSHESRIHLDIETDDIDAEVARLEALGARKLEKVQTWTVMEAPTGQRFCVIRLQRGPLGEDANSWPAR